MNEEKKTEQLEATTHYQWWPEGGCFADGSDLPEMVAVKMRAVQNAAEVLRYIPGTAFYPPGTVCKMGRIPVAVRTVRLDGGDK